MMADDLFERGMDVRRRIFGAERADAAMASATGFQRPLEELVTRYCFGEVWNRPGLTQRERSMLTLAMVLALNRPAAFKTHVRGAIANGVTEEEIREIIVHAAIYCGVPAAVDATGAAMEVLKELGKA